VIDARAATESETATRMADVIVCRACDHAITKPAHRIERDGSHVHTRMNPFNWVHQFGCFAEAPGARAEGDATDAATWFAGYAWRMAICGGCGQHLGWRYEGPAIFWGLLLEKRSPSA
jgi:hypothetical protein